MSRFPEPDGGAPAPARVHEALSSWLGEHGSDMRLPPELADAVRERFAARQGPVSQVPSLPILQPVAGVGGAVSRGHGLGPSGLTFETLRSVRERSPIFQAIHRARQAQMRAFGVESFGNKGEVGWRIIHRDFKNPRAEVPRSIKPYIERATRLFRRPAPRYNVHTVGDLLAGTWEDFATLNRPMVELLRHPDGSIGGVRVPDAANIWETSTWLMRWARGETARALFSRYPGLTPEQQLHVASEHLGVDVVGSRYVYVESGVPFHALRERDLLIGTALTRTDNRYGPYPPGYVEDCLEVALHIVNAFEYNGSFFTTGMTNDVVLLIKDTLGDQALRSFVQALTEATQGVQNAHRPAVLPVQNPDAVKSLNVFGRSSRDMQFEVWDGVLWAIGCAIYRMHPSTINRRSSDAGASPSLNAPSEQKQIALAQEEGLRSDLRHLVEALLTPAVQEIHPDLIVQIDDGVYDPEKQGRINEVELRTRQTPNELRVADGQRPIGDYVAPDDWDDATDEERKAHERNPNNWIQNPTLVQALQSYHMMKDQQEQAAQQGQGGLGGGMPPDDGYPAEDGEDGQEPEPDEEPEQSPSRGRR